MTDILIVEDNKADQLFIKRALEKLVTPLSYEIANDGQEALEWLEQSDKPKVIVTDLKMPRMDGRELVKAIKSNETMKQIPTLVFSTSNDQNDIEACYRDHANAYIVKPSSPSDYAKFAQRIHEFWIEQAALPH